MFYQLKVFSETFSPFRSAKKVLILFRCSLQQRTCEANPAGENSSFIFTVGVKCVPLYHFKLAYVVLHTAVKEFFESHFCNVSVNSKRYQPPPPLPPTTSGHLTKNHAPGAGLCPHKLSWAPYGADSYSESLFGILKSMKQNLLSVLRTMKYAVMFCS